MWKLPGGSPRTRSSEPFALPSKAVSYACGILKQGPLQIWIEGPAGVRIEQSAIERLCSAGRPDGRVTVAQGQDGSARRE